MAKKKVQQPQNDITEFFDALAAYAAEKGIDKDVFAEKIKSAIEKSLKTSMHVEDKDSECVFVTIDFDRRIFNVSVLKEVIEVVDTIEINHNEVLLMRQDQIPGEVLHVGDIIKVYITGVSKEYKEGAKKQSLRITRTDRGLIKRLFELECPEIYDGTVEIKAVSRTPGSRSKIAVISNDPNVDAVGACIGTQKSRINAVTKELKGEKIDVVLWSEDLEEFIKQALKPAEVLRVVITNPDPKKKECKAIVPDNQLSLAIGNKGQNALLAAKLTSCKIDIKAESKVTPEDLIVTEYIPEEPEEVPAEEEAKSEAPAENAESAANAEG